MKYVFISGPYSSNHAKGVREAIDVANALSKSGFAVFIPHLTHFWDLMSPHDYEFWMKQDLAWVERCDFVYRIIGPSKGADRECDFAKSLGKKVYTNLIDLFNEQLT